MSNIKTKKKNNKNNTRTKKKYRNKRNYTNILKEKKGGFILDFLFKSKLNRVIAEFINITKSDIKDSIINNLFKNLTYKKFINISKLDKYITTFLLTMLTSFYKMLKKNKRLFKVKNDKSKKIEDVDYNHKHIFKITKNKLQNNYILAVLKEFISLLFNKSKSLDITNIINNKVYNYSNYYTNYGYNNNNISISKKIVTYFKDNDISINTVNNYLQEVIDFDIKQKKKLFSLTEYNDEKKTPFINYNKIMHIENNNTKNVSNNIGNINNNYNNKIYLIIFKNYSVDNPRDKFKFISDVSIDDFYILENNFIKIRYSIDKYFNMMRKDSKFKNSNLKKKDIKKTDYILKDINNYFFNANSASKYGVFLYYLYLSVVVNYL
jgi:hypothetical protein